MIYEYFTNKLSEKFEWNITKKFLTGQYYLDIRIQVIACSIFMLYIGPPCSIVLHHCGVNYILCSYSFSPVYKKRLKYS